jgi:cytochrome P450
MLALCGCLFEGVTVAESKPGMKLGWLADLTMAQRPDRAASWRRIREAGDVWEVSPGLWMLTSPDAVHFAHRHPEIFSNDGVMRIHDLPVRPVPGSVDPPEHVAIRRILDPMLAPRVVNAMEAELRLQVRELVRAFASRGHCDAVRELAVPYPTEVFLSVFGLPVEDRERLIEWVKTMIEHSPNFERDGNTARDAAWELYRYLEDYVGEKRARPGDDMLSRIVALDDGDAWPVGDIIGMCFLFAMAGLDTVTASIGFMLQYLASDAELRHRVIEDPDAANALIEEVLRLEPAAPMFPRLTKETVEVCGVEIPAGAVVMLVLATANRDPDRYDHPDDVDLAQADRGHVTFGGGVHRCLGSHLARRELRLVLEEFHALVPDYEIAPGFEPEIVWPSGTLHLRELPLVFPVGDAS